jgi:hypothetical protein
MRSGSRWKIVVRAQSGAGAVEDQGRMTAMGPPSARNAFISLHDVATLMLAALRRMGMWRTSLTEGAGLMDTLPIEGRARH